GLSGVPEAGDRVEAVPDERTARQLVATNTRAAEHDGADTSRTTLRDLFQQIQSGDVKEVTLLVKADVQGSIEPILQSLARLEQETGIHLKVLQSGTGNINDSDVMLATASKAIVIGFNVRAEPSARRVADAQGVDVRVYTVIYHLIDDIRKALAGMLEP